MSGLSLSLGLGLTSLRPSGGTPPPTPAPVITFDGTTFANTLGNPGPWQADGVAIPGEVGATMAYIEATMAGRAIQQNVGGVLSNVVIGEVSPPALTTVDFNGYTAGTKLTAPSPGPGFTGGGSTAETDKFVIATANNPTPYALTTAANAAIVYKDMGVTPFQVIESTNIAVPSSRVGGIIIKAQNELNFLDLYLNGSEQVIVGQMINGVYTSLVGGLVFRRPGVDLPGTQFRLYASADGFYQVRIKLADDADFMPVKKATTTTYSDIEDIWYPYSDTLKDFNNWGLRCTSSTGGARVFDHIKVGSYRQLTFVTVSDAAVENIAGANYLILGGTYSPSIATLELLVLDGNGYQVLPWTDLVGPASGTFGGAISAAIPPGTVGQISYYVRDKADAKVFTSGTAAIPASLDSIDYARTMGLNLTSTNYYGGQFMYANLGRYSEWIRRTGGAREYSAAYTNSLGDIIAMPAGGHEIIIPTIRATPYKIRIRWTGPGTVQDYYTGYDNVTAVSSAPNDVTILITPSQQKWINIRFAFTAAANPIVGLDVREVDDNGNEIDPGTWRQEFLDFVAGASPLRFLGAVGDQDGVNSETAIHRNTNAERTSPNCRYPARNYTQASLTHGAGNAGLLFTANTTANYYSGPGWDQLTRVMAASGMKSLIGAAGNQITVTILAPSGSGSVTYNFTGGTYNVVVTPATGGTTASAIRAQIRASDAFYFVDVALVGDGTGTPGTLAKTSLAGGLDPVNWGGMAVEDQVDLCNQVGADMDVPLPVFAADDWYQYYFTYVRDNLDAGLRLYIPTGNETWNTADPYYRDAIPLAALGELYNGAATGLTMAQKVYYGYAYRYRQIIAIAETVFAGQLDRIVRVGESIQTGAGSTSTIDFLCNPADARYIGDKVDVFAVAPYFEMFGFVDDVAWSAGQSYTKYKPVYDAVTTKVYFAPAAYTSGASAAADIAAGKLLELTAPNADPYMMAELSARLSTAATLQARAALYTNDKGNSIGLMYYEGSQGNAIDHPSNRTAEPYLTQIKTFWKHPLQGKWESAYHGETLRLVSPTVTRVAFNALNGYFGWNHYGNWGLSEFMNSSDIDRPRYIAWQEAQSGLFNVYYASGENPTLIGARTVGTVLTCNARPRWATSIAYQWYRGATLISGATGRNYAQVSGDIGANVHCVVTAANASYSLAYDAGTAGGNTSA